MDQAPHCGAAPVNPPRAPHTRRRLFFGDGDGMTKSLRSGGAARERSSLSAPLAQQVVRDRA
ncbi:MAG TPA: hypothetical protein VFI50_07665, partial [Casimicrobiaceae bacterium]|nr:hypothetical protein [Casimicrobiaceae bacterium]